MTRDERGKGAKGPTSRGSGAGVERGSAAAGARRGSGKRAGASGRRVGAPQAFPVTFALGAILALGLVLRLWELSQQPWVTVDGTEYIRFADALRHGRLFASIFPPGYPALIALARVAVADRVLAAALVSLVTGAALPWPVWRLAREAVGPRWALAAAALVAVHPVLLVFSSISMSESAFVLALYGALALVAPARGGQRAWAAPAAGLALGAAFAIRPEALVAAAALAALALLALARRRASPRAIGLAAAGFLAVAAPCWLYFHAEFGAWTITPKIEALRVEAGSWRAEEVRPGAATPAAERFDLGSRLARFGGAALARYPARALLHARSLLQLWPVPLLALSLLGLWWRRGIEAVGLLHVLAIPLLALSGQPRFVLGAVPALAVLAVVPLARVRRADVRWGLAALAVAGAAWAYRRNGPDLVLPFDAHLGAERDAGEWLASVAAPGDAVMDRKPYVAFYADLDYRVMPDVPYDDILNGARASGVRYLVVEQGVARVFRPQLLPLLHDREFLARERRLDAVYVGGRFRGYAIGVFRVLRDGEAKSGRPPFVNVAWGSAPTLR